MNLILIYCGETGFFGVLEMQLLRVRGIAYRKNFCGRLFQGKVVSYERNSVEL